MFHSLCLSTVERVSRAAVKQNASHAACEAARRGLFCDTVVVFFSARFEADQFVYADREVEFDVEDLSFAVVAVVDEGGSDPAVGCFFFTVYCVGNWDCDVTTDIIVLVSGVSVQ